MEETVDAKIGNIRGGPGMRENEDYSEVAINRQDLWCDLSPF